MEFFCRRWCSREQTRLGVTLVDLVFIEELKEVEAMEQHFCGSKNNVEGCKGRGCC